MNTNVKYSKENTVQRKKSAVSCHRLSAIDDQYLRHTRNIDPIHRVSSTPSDSEFHYTPVSDLSEQPGSLQLSRSESYWLASGEKIGACLLWLKTRIGFLG